MRKWLRIFGKIAAAVALLTLLLMWDLFSYWPIPPACGQLMAHIDVARGRYRLLTYGMAEPWRPKYASILRRRYGVELSVVGGSVVPVSAAEYSEAYDRVSKAAVNRKFGRDVIDQAFSEARVGWVEDMIQMRYLMGN